jgi:hypothetical protein
MKYRHTLDDGVSKVQDDVHGAAIQNIHGIQPRRMRERDAVLCIGQEVDLDVCGMDGVRQFDSRCARTAPR